MKTIKRIIRGMGYLEGMGHHPGNWWLLSSLLLGGLAGSFRNGIYVGVYGFLSGVGLMLIGMGIPYLYGCHMRTIMYEKDMEKTFNILATKKDVDQNTQSPV